MDSDDLEKEFRIKAEAEVLDGIESRKVAIRLQADVSNNYDNKTVSTEKNKAISESAFACEHFFKAPIIYNDLKNNKGISSLAPKERNKQIEKFLSNPKKIQSSIIMSNDARKTKKLVLEENDNQKITGHDLFAYYQLQNPIMSSLINHEYLTKDGENNNDWVLYAILTKDNIFTETGTIGKEMSKELLNSLNENKNAYQEYRYSSTLEDNSPETATKKYNFLSQLSSGLENVMTTYYPSWYSDQNDFKLEYDLGIKFNELHVARSIKNTLLNLDCISNYYIQNEFTPNEFRCFLNEMNVINSDSNLNNEAKMIYRKVYSNLSIYLKHSAIIKDISILFDEKVFKRIHYYCKTLMNSNVFDEKCTQFTKQTFFIENKAELEKELNSKRLENKTLIYKQLLNNLSTDELKEESIKKLVSIKKLTQEQEIEQAKKEYRLIIKEIAQRRIKEIDDENNTEKKRNKENKIRRNKWKKQKKTS